MLPGCAAISPSEPLLRVAGLHGVVHVADLVRCAAFHAALAGLDVVARDAGLVTLASHDVEISAAVKLSFPVPNLRSVADQAPA